MTVTARRVDYHVESDRKNLILLMDEYAKFELGDDRRDFQSLPDQLIKFPTAFSVLGFADDSEAQAVGLVNCMFGFSTFMGKQLVNIHDAIVTETHRGQGVVNIMLEEVERIAREAGCCRLTLEVYEDNTPARRAYAKNGFTGDPVHPDVHTLFLRKLLE
ncbi:MAG: GNAT family N-acetyltransferase [Planctomycetota bacterium]